MDTNAFVLQLRFSAWASRRVLEATASLPAEELHRDLRSSYGGVWGTLVHIYQADSIWFDRLMGKPTADLARYAPAADFAAFAKQWGAVLDTYVSWGEKLTAAEWDRVVSYRNLKGEPGAQANWQIILHLVNHASYHRGQITTMLRQLGREPIGTDLITYYRGL